jgi:hypothetical protein
MEAAYLEALQAALDRSSRREVRFQSGELLLYVNGTAALDKIHLNEPANRLAQAYWRWLLLSGLGGRSWAIRSRPSSAAGSLRRFGHQQFIERVVALAEEVAAIEADEHAINETLYGLYRLTP